VVLLHVQIESCEPSDASDACYLLPTSLITDDAEKLYECKMCRRRFNDTSHLTTDIDGIEIGAAELMCDTCDMLLNTTDRRHRLNGNTTGQFHYMHNTSGRSSAVIRYKRTRKDKRPTYVCDVCLQRFTNRERLIIHRSKHADTKPYVCDACQKVFVKLRNLTAHKCVHTGDVPYKCGSAARRSYNHFS